MADFMVMILADESRDAQLAPAEMKALLEGHAVYEEKLRAASAFFDAERLRPSAEGRRVRVRDGKARVEIGPFGQGPLAGYYLVQAESLDAAAKLAEGCPMAPGSALDVRPVMTGKLPPGKSDAQGRVFARARRLGGHAGYVLQAEIAACHVTAATWESTDWERILRRYDELLAQNPSPIVALNRAVALCMRDGPAAALAALVEIEDALASYHLFYALRADFLRRLGEDARDDYRRALELATNDSERNFLRRQIDSAGREPM